MLRASIAGTLRMWYGDVGDLVDSDEIIAEIETTDGTQVQVVAPVAGRITQIHTLVGEPVARGAVLAHIDEAQSLHALLDGSQKPKRKAAAAPMRRQRQLVLTLLVGLVLIAGLAIFMMTDSVLEPQPTVNAATPMSRFQPGGYALLREPIGDLPTGTVQVQTAFYDGTKWQYTVSASGVTAEVPESLLDGAPVPAPTPTMIYDFRLWSWANFLVLAEPVADFPAGTRVRISSAIFDGVDWQVDVITEGGFSLTVREAQLALPPDPPANPLVTPTAAFLNDVTWNSYSLVTLEQVGDIPANTLVRVLSARYGFDGWIYTVVSKGDSTGVEALESQIGVAS